MHLRCRLREIRADRTLREIADTSGVAVPTLSLIERGLMLPRDDQVEELENAYGIPLAEWYDRPTLLALQHGDET